MLDEATLLHPDDIRSNVEQTVPWRDDLARFRLGETLRRRWSDGGDHRRRNDEMTECRHDDASQAFLSSRAAAASLRVRLPPAARCGIHDDVVDTLGLGEHGHMA
jgi:hypothetical protein